MVETTGGKTDGVHGSREMTGRGGKGFEAVKRTSVRARRAAADRAGGLGPGGGAQKPKEKPAERNGDGKNGEQKGLFE